MIAQHTQELQKFISDNNLKREDGIILFSAIIDLYKLDETSRFTSEIEVLTLPEEMALYILEFFGTENPEKEMYRTSRQQFVCSSQQELEILDSKSDTRLIISLKAVPGPQ